MGQTATSMALQQKQQQSQPALGSLPERPSIAAADTGVDTDTKTDNSPGTEPKCVNCKIYGTKCFTHGKKMMSARRYKPSSDVGEFTGHWSQQERIRPTNADHVRVKRAYRSANSIFQNTTATEYDGAGFSFRFVYDGEADTIVPAVMLGSPQNGTDTTIRFPNAHEESRWLSATFRYVRLNKIQMTVVRAQQSMMMPTMVEGDGSIVQVGMAGNGSRDPGRIMIRPWAGQPDMVSFTTGQLVEFDWTDNFRKKLKVTAPATSPGGVQKPLTMTLTPVQVNISPNDGDIGDGIVRYIRTPTCEWSDIVTGASNLNSFGFIWFWHHPSLVGAITGLIKLDVFWEIELEWFGLVHPEGVPLIADAESKEEAKGVIFSDSKEAMIALATGQPANIVDRAAFDAVKRGADPPPVIIQTYPDVEKEKARENQQAAVQEDYVQVPRGK